MPNDSEVEQFHWFLVPGKVETTALTHTPVSQHLTGTLTASGLQHHKPVHCVCPLSEMSLLDKMFGKGFQGLLYSQER